MWKPISENSINWSNIYIWLDILLFLCILLPMFKTESLMTLCLVGNKQDEFQNEKKKAYNPFSLHDKANCQKAFN